MLSILKVQDLCALAGERGTGVRDIAIGAGGLKFNYGADQIGTVLPMVRLRYDVTSELGCTGAKP